MSTDPDPGVVVGTVLVVVGRTVDVVCVVGHLRDWGTPCGRCSVDPDEGVVSKPGWDPVS